MGINETDLYLNFNNFMGFTGSRNRPRFVVKLEIGAVDIDQYDFFISMQQI